MSEQALCNICGEPMPQGEEMFNYHGYSCDCPKPPLPKSGHTIGKIHWVSFKDEQPKDKQRILVCWIPEDGVWDLDNSRQQIVTFRNCPGQFRLSLDCEMVHGYLKLDLENVFTHWSPLPNPPTATGKEI